MAPFAARRTLLWWPYRSLRNDYPWTWSDPEGSSHSGNIVCRGVAGGVASISKSPFFIRKNTTELSDFSWFFAVGDRFSGRFSLWSDKGAVCSLKLNGCVWPDFIYRICLSNAFISSTFLTSRLFIRSGYRWGKSSTCRLLCGVLCCVILMYYLTCLIGY